MENTVNVIISMLGITKEKMSEIEDISKVSIQNYFKNKKMENQ